MLARLARGVMGKKIPKLEMACDGRFTTAHGQICRLHLGAYDHLSAQIAELDQLVAEAHRRAVDSARIRCIRRVRISLVPVNGPVLLLEAAAMEDGERTTRPATIGELRQRLRSLGEPWSVPTRCNDDDPLPDAPPQPVSPGHVRGLRAVNSREEFESILREAPPVNPFLAARWRELGVAVPSTAEGAPEGAGTPTPGQDVPEWGVG